MFLKNFRLKFILSIITLITLISGNFYVSNAGWDANGYYYYSASLTARVGQLLTYNSSNDTFTTQLSFPSFGFPNYMYSPSDSRPTDISLYKKTGDTIELELPLASISSCSNGTAVPLDITVGKAATYTGNSNISWIVTKDPISNSCNIKGTVNYVDPLNPDYTLEVQYKYNGAFKYALNGDKTTKTPGAAVGGLSFNSSDSKIRFYSSPDNINNYILVINTSDSTYEKFEVARNGADTLELINYLNSNPQYSLTLGEYSFTWTGADGVVHTGTSYHIDVQSPNPIVFSNVSENIALYVPVENIVLQNIVVFKDDTVPISANIEPQTASDKDYLTTIIANPNIVNLNENSIFGKSSGITSVKVTSKGVDINNNSISKESKVNVIDISPINDASCIFEDGAVDIPVVLTNVDNQIVDYSNFSFKFENENSTNNYFSLEATFDPINTKYRIKLKPRTIFTIPQTVNLTISYQNEMNIVTKKSISFNVLVTTPIDVG